MMDERPGEVYLLTLHLPAGQEDTFRTLRHFLGQAVHAVQEDRIGDAAR